MEKSYNVVSGILGERAWRDQRYDVTIQFKSGILIEITAHKKVTLSKGHTKKVYKIETFTGNYYQLLRKFEENNSK